MDPGSHFERRRPSGRGLSQTLRQGSGLECSNTSFSSIEECGATVRFEEHPRQRVCRSPGRSGTFVEPGEYAEVLPDLAASDHRAVRMPGNHSEWAFRINGKAIAASHPAKRCKLYVVARVEKDAGTNSSVAFAVGIYDNEKKDYPTQAKINCLEAGQTYHSYFIGSFEPSESRDVFVSPASNAAVKAIWIDRAYLVPNRDGKMKMRLLVTGAGGFVAGSVITQGSEDWDVHALSEPMRHRKRARSPGTSAIRWSMTN